MKRPLVPTGHPGRGMLLSSYADQILTLYVLAKATFQKSLMYVWAHLATNVGSLLFGFIYIALWRAALHGRNVHGFGAQTLVHYIAVTQTVLWITTFLPRDLGISTLVHTGQIAIEFGRPVGFLKRTVASAAGDIFYNVMFRSSPLAAAFAIAGVYPWRNFSSWQTDGRFVLALAMGSLVGVFLQYMIGMSAFWTGETRWARRLYFAVLVFAGGQILPLQLMPVALRSVLRWMPFQSMVNFPVSVMLHHADAQAWMSAGVWVLVMGLGAHLITRQAMRRVEIQGG